MKKSLKALVSACAVLALGVGAASAQAARTDITVTDPDARIFAEGTPAVFPSEDGKTLYPALSYQDSTYMPLRAVGQWMGKTVAWDEATQTVTLSGSIARSIPSEDDAQYQAVGVNRLAVDGKAQLAPDISVLLDGQKQTFKNQKGAVIYPLFYQNAVYLPLRNIGELTGYEVTWHGKTSEKDVNGIFLRTPVTKAQKTELQGFVSTLFPKVQSLDQLMTQFRDAAFTEVKTVYGAETTLTNADAAARFLPQIKAQAQELRKTAAPTGTLLTHYYQQMMAELDLLINNADSLTSKIQGGAQPTIAASGKNPAADETLNALVIHYTSANTLLQNCEWMQRMIDQNFNQMY